jgi:hypothetical protein
VAARGAGDFLENTPVRIGSGTHQITTDTIESKTCKVVNCVTSGVLYVPTTEFHQTPTEAAYGKWEFWFYKGADGTAIQIPFITNLPVAPGTGENGYHVTITSSEALQLRRRTGGAGTTLWATAVSYINNNQWYKLTMIRSNSGVFTAYLDDVLVNVTGGSGTNPVTDTNHTVSNYFVADLDSANQLSWANSTGDYSVKKQLTTADVA